MLRAYYARVDFRAEPERFMEELSAYRLERLERTKLPARRAAGLAAELLLIDSLKTLGSLSLPMDIYTLPGGKPRLGQGPCFSLSHSGELVFCALSETEVGCDVQKIPESEPSLRLLERCLSPGERRLYRESENRQELFSVLWSLKESYAKMDGAGLGPLPPSEIDIRLLGPGAAAVTGSGAMLWYRAEGGYVFSLCSEKYGTPQEFMLRELPLKGDKT